MNIVHIHSIVMYLVVYIMVGPSVVGGCGNRGLPSDKLYWNGQLVCTPASRTLIACMSGTVSRLGTGISTICLA